MGGILTTMFLSIVLSCLLATLVSDLNVAATTTSTSTTSTPTTSTSTTTTTTTTTTPTITTTTPIHEGCCSKVKVESDGIGSKHFWAMGTYERIEMLEKLENCNKTIYVNTRSAGNIHQFYLEGCENEGWKIGRVFEGEVEKYIYYDGEKIKCPADEKKSDWFVLDGNEYSPDSELTIQCIE